MARVFFVGAGPGDPDLITLKGDELLRSAEVLVYTGSLVNPELISRSSAPIKVDSWGMSLEEIVELMAKEAKEGKKVVRLHSGDPSIYGSIVEQMVELDKRGVDYEVIPGVSSLFAASAALRTQYTLKGVSEALIITRPSGQTLEDDELEELSAHKASLVIFLGSDRIEEVVSKIRRPPDTPAAVVYHASWPDQKVIVGTLSDIAERAKREGISRSALIIIGEVVDPKLRYERSVLYS
ncbi:MAG: precorrin-4 C(11)-methyltransferase [Methanomassiliicoccales archaeon]